MEKSYFKKDRDTQGKLVTFLSDAWAKKGYWISKGDAENRNANAFYSGGWTLHNKTSEKRGCALVWRSTLWGISCELEKIEKGE
tara:strand:+ start:23 stop:274 length:252 start_codon:yes stop_codon:yes gene_type:complete